MSKNIKLELAPSEKQLEFFRSCKKYTAYGGARGGGKSWALRHKIALLCLYHPGISVLLMRRSYGELIYNHVRPLEKFFSQIGDIAKFSGTKKEFTFFNGSTIKLGYLRTDGDLKIYQGQEYDIIGIDEATQISEFAFFQSHGVFARLKRFPETGIHHM